MDIRKLAASKTIPGEDILDDDVNVIGLAQSETFQTCEGILFSLIEENLKKLRYKETMEVLYKKKKLCIAVTEDGLKHYVIGGKEILYHTFPVYSCKSNMVDGFWTMACEITVYNLI